MASNDEQLATHLTACTLGYQFHLRLETNAFVPLQICQTRRTTWVMGHLATCFTQQLERDGATRSADNPTVFHAQSHRRTEYQSQFVSITHDTHVRTVMKVRICFEEADSRQVTSIDQKFTSYRTPPRARLSNLLVCHLLHAPSFPRQPLRPSTTHLLTVTCTMRITTAR
ncbi:hypothetical protein BDU57DRAFT_194700 [Ampelomyces quisqualis]|uniref:Uncharacterized protein n=1 Tax=Ampelomyces quisqualis TaxID=50730 RepID=A0A6A5QUT1_AMPQU|nr:hypothetical protein BDU57DRAFT_194700 [Ampelomyces quisqualis]